MEKGKGNGKEGDTDMAHNGEEGMENTEKETDACGNGKPQTGDSSDYAGRMPDRADFEKVGKSGRIGKSGKIGQKLLYLCYGALPTLTILFFNFFSSLVITTVAAVVFGRSGADSATVYRQVSDWVDTHPQLLTIGYQVPALLVGGAWFFLATKNDRKRAGASGFAHSNLGFGKLLLIVSAGFTGQFLCGLFIMVEGRLMPRQMEVYADMMESAGFAETSVPTILMTVILAPLLEELMLRGLTVYILTKTGWKFWIINILQAALFGLMHMNVIQGIYAFLLGLILGYICHRFHSLIASILFHACFNLSGITLVPLLISGEDSVAAAGRDMAVYMGGAILCIICLFLIRLVTKPSPGTTLAQTE